MAVKVKLWPAEEAGAELSTGGDSGGALEFEVDYLSLINDGTFGKPPLLTKGEGQSRPVADAGETVLYVNPANVVALEATRED
jgi:hypothetical protein